jgi:hypothetical protein
MATPLVVTLPFARSEMYYRFIRWYTEGGMLTDFSAPGGDRTDVYEELLPKPSKTNTRACVDGYDPPEPYPGACCVSWTFPEQTDPACLHLFSARWTNWPFYTNGPLVFRIKRKTSASPARSWDVVGRSFRIKAFGGAVLWSYSLVGKTLEEVLDAANAQTDGPVTMTWNTATTPNAFSRGLSAETYFEDQSPDPLTAGLIPPSTSTPADIRLFHLTTQEDVPNPQTGQCSATFDRIGWQTFSGNAVLWSDINQEYAYGRGACSRALYEEMCQGVGFAGANNYYSASQVPCEDVLGSTSGTGCSGNDCPFTFSDSPVCAVQWNAGTGTCCSRSWSVVPAASGDCSVVECSVDIGSSNLPFRVGPLSESEPLDCTSTAVVTTLSDYGQNFSDCCTEYGYECWAYASRQTYRTRIYEHRKVERIA